MILVDTINEAGCPVGSCIGMVFHGAVGWRGGTGAFADGGEGRHGVLVV
jgi:hypothetical protein